MHQRGWDERPGLEERGPPVSRQGAPLVVSLSDALALDAALTGSKAAALARAAVAGLATLPGTVLTSAFAAEVDLGTEIRDHPATPAAFAQATRYATALVVRSSSPLEDAATSSMAGQLESVLDVRGFDAFVAAVGAILASRHRAGLHGTPIAVLAQPLLRPALGGVLFGVDPVSGRSDRLAVSAVRGGPEPLVSGRVQGARYLLDTDGAVLESAANDGPALGRRNLRRLVALSGQVARLFGGPQDIEWAITDDDQLWLLQSRPVTTDVRGVPEGPIYGPGPVAETFPEPLTELEEDLWVPPLRQAVQAAVRLAGTATKAQLAGRPAVVTVAGRVAIDLELAGEIAPHRSLMSRLNPVPVALRVGSAWRVGRLRSALPRLAEDLIERVDTDLEMVPSFEKLTTRQLVALLHRSRVILRALHAHEILMSMLTDTGHNRMTGAAVALRILDEARRDGLSDEEIVHRSPAVLALTGPRVAAATTLPAEVTSFDLGTDYESANDNGILREALRMRVRWLQELSGRAAWALGERLAATGGLTDPESVRHMTLEDLEAIITGRALVVTTLAAGHRHDFGTPLPAWFQISDLGKPVGVRRDAEVGGGTGAGGGVGRGPVTHDADDPPAGSVLVTTTLRPGLGPLLSRLEGIVAETGSVLSHLAILAREAGVATVVGYAGAMDDLPEGTSVRVDGETGHVAIEPGEAP